MADLWDKLRAAKARTEVQSAEPEPSTTKDPSESAPEGWTWVDSLVAERRLRFAVDARFWRAVGAQLAPETWHHLLCFDTETTGLSGGAGTVAFLIGWARLLPPEAPGELPGVEVRQWFLRDLPGESSLIASVDSALEEARGLVSFNGASFDLPLLRSRWALAGRSFPPRAHRDNLHPSRRLWKRILPTCKLGQIEESVLGIRRQDDVPGALVPALWFDYLRQGASADFHTPLEGVLRHHAQDVYSLLCLDLLLASLRENPNAGRWHEAFGPLPVRVPIVRPAAGGLLHPDLPPSVGVDFWGLLALRNQESADRRLEAVWLERQDEPVGLAWGDRLKRRHDERAEEVWKALWKGKQSFAALEELLKWLEHRVRTAEARQRALELITEAQRAPFLPREWRERLEKRRTRLSRFLSSEAT